MKLNSIQFLRAVAALLVVYEHSMDIQVRLGSSWQQRLYHLNNFGCIGVDLFFVISGFIITYIANKYTGVTQGAQFLIKRFVRINPTYYIASLFCLGALILRLALYKTPFTREVNQTISSLIDTILMIPTSGEIRAFKPLLIVGWTLAFEWLFYCLFFITILCKVKRKIIVLPGLILSLIIMGQLVKPNDLRLQFITNPIMMEFILGIIICHLYLSIKKIKVWIASTCLVLGLTTYLLLIRFGYGNVWYYLSAINGSSSLNKFLLWGLPSGFIVAGCIFLEKNEQLNRLWSNKWALIGGDASYSIYLIHYTIFGLFMLLYQKTGFRLHPDIMIWVQMIVAISISLLFYKLVENPLLKYMQKSSLWNFSLASRNKVKPEAKPVI